MRDLFYKIRNISFQSIAFVCSFVVAYLPKLAAADSVSGLVEIAKSKGWETKDCQLGSWMSGSCITCPIFKALLTTAGSVASASYNALHSGLAMVVAVGTAVWIALRMIKYVSSFEAVEPFKMLQDFAYQLFRSMVVILILNSYFTQVRGLTLDPIFRTGMNITQAVSGSGADCSGAPTISQAEAGGIDAEMGSSLLCSVYQIEQKSIEVIDVGGTGFCLATDKAVAKKIIGRLYWPKFSYAITGLLMMCLGMFFLFLTPFLLIDCVVNMCFAFILLPVGVACYAFKISTRYLKHIWDTFISAIFNFIFLSLILYIMFKCIDNIFIDVGGNVNAAEAGVKSFGSVLYGMVFYGINFVKMAFIFFLGWSILESVAELTKDFGGGGLNPTGRAKPKSIARDLGKQFATAIGRTAKSTYLIGKATRGAFNEASGINDLKRHVRKWASNKASDVTSHIKVARHYAASAIRTDIRDFRDTSRLHSEKIIDDLIARGKLSEKELAIALRHAIRHEKLETGLNNVKSHTKAGAHYIASAARTDITGFNDTTRLHSEQIIDDLLARGKLSEKELAIALEHAIELEKIESATGYGQEVIAKRTQKEAQAYAQSVGDNPGDSGRGGSGSGKGSNSDDSSRGGSGSGTGGNSGGGNSDISGGGGQSLDNINSPSNNNGSNPRSINNGQPSNNLDSTGNGNLSSEINASGIQITGNSQGNPTDAVINKPESEQFIDDFLHEKTSAEKTLDEMLASGIEYTDDELDIALEAGIEQESEELAQRKLDEDLALDMAIEKEKEEIALNNTPRDDKEKVSDNTDDSSAATTSARLDDIEEQHGENDIEELRKQRDEVLTMKRKKREKAREAQEREEAELELERERLQEEEELRRLRDSFYD